MIDISFISQEQTLFEGQAKMVVMDGKEGQLGVVKGHSPLLAILKPGPVRMITDDSEEVFFTNGGFAEVQPDRQLKWMVEALHGSVNPDGLTIPLLGVTAKDVVLFTKKEGEITRLKLVIADGDNEPLEREMPLPEAVQGLSANYVNGRLHLRW